MVRPIAKSPPNRLRYGRPSTRRSASRSLASSTRAAPTSRAWRRTGSSCIFAASATDLGSVENLLRLVGAAGDVGVERKRPADLDDVDGDQLRADGPGELRGHADDALVTGSSGEREDGSPEDGRVGFGHRCGRPPRLGRGTAGPAWSGPRGGAVAAVTIPPARGPRQSTSWVRARPRRARAALTDARSSAGFAAASVAGRPLLERLGVLPPVRDVDHDRVGPAQQEPGPQPTGRLVVEDPFPPAAWPRTPGRPRTSSAPADPPARRGPGRRDRR